MAFFEIEKKYLVSDGFRGFVSRSVHIRQGYLNSDPMRTVRVRICGDEAFLTVKGPDSEDGPGHFEWETSIGTDDALRLMPLCERGAVEKIRHLVPWCGHVIEVDEFLGDNAGLIIAETELASAQESFPLPDWIGREVTSDRRYSNSYLASHPFAGWSGDETQVKP